MSKQHSEQKGEGTGNPLAKPKLFKGKPASFGGQGNSAPGKHKRGQQG